MADKDAPQGKIEIKIGNLSFSAEGDQKWLAEQLTKVIDAAEPAIGAITNASDNSVSTGGSISGPPGNFSGSLASFIKLKGGETKQVRRFLVAAAWLHNRGEKTLTTTAVAKALQENQQKKLGNPADCLNQNVGRGLCEKTSEGFFITPEGWTSLEGKE